MTLSKFATLVAVVAAFSNASLTLAADAKRNPASEASSAEETTTRSNRWGDLRLQGLGVLQTTGNSLTAMFSWAPTIRINDTWGIRPMLGLGAALSGQTTIPVVLITDLTVAADWRLSDNFSLEVGPGVQAWLLLGTSIAPTATLGAVYHFSKPLWIVDGLIADYTAVFLSNNLTHVGRVGIYF